MTLLASNISSMLSVKQYFIRSCDPLVTSSLNTMLYLNTHTDVHSTMYNNLFLYLLLTNFLIMPRNFVPSVVTMPIKCSKKYHSAFISLIWPQCSSNGIGALYTSSITRKVLESLYTITTNEPSQE